MYTQCPHCQTCFRIAEAHLKIAKGKVRCGSCQEVFDATQNLFKNLTDREPITDFKQPPPKPAVSPRLPPEETQHIDLFSPPTPAQKAANEARREREKMPDQSKFMESTVGSDRYNDLDKLGPIKIPGEINFGDSFIKFAEKEPVSEAPEEATHEAERTPYEDFDAKESAATTADHDSIKDFYAQVDAQLEDKDAGSQKDDRSQLDKDIDELLAFARGLDMDSDLEVQPQEKPTIPAPRETKQAPVKVEDDFNLDDLAEFEEVQPQKKPTTPAPHQTKQAPVKVEDEFNLDDLAEFEEVQPQKKPTTPAPLRTKPAPVKVEDEFNLDDLAEFEKELDATSTGVFAVQQQIADELTDFDEHAEDELEIAAPAATASATDFDELPFAEAEPEPETPKPVSKKKSSRSVADDLPSPDEDIPRALRQSLDSLNTLPTRSVGQTLLFIFIILILIGGLGFQAVLFKNVELAHKFPSLATLLTSACDRLPCRYSGKIDVSQIKLLNRDVRSHPSQQNALLISAAFVNQASFDQPYPTILITLSDLSGSVVASRRFTPQEYLDNIYNRFILMESGTPVHVTLAVLDPGNDAINFEFSFM